MKRLAFVQILDLGFASVSNSNIGLNYWRLQRILLCIIIRIRAQLLYFHRTTWKIGNYTNKYKITSHSSNDRAEYERVVYRVKMKRHAKTKDISEKPETTYFARGCTGVSTNFIKARRTRYHPLSATTIIPCASLVIRNAQALPVLPSYTSVRSHANHNKAS